MSHLHRLRHLLLLVVLIASLVVVASPARAMDANVNTCDFASL